MDGAPSALALGDNIFFGLGLTKALVQTNSQTRGGTVFAYQVAHPGRYGVVKFEQNGHVTSIIEKPEFPASNFAVTGLYFLAETASERAKQDGE